MMISSATRDAAAPLALCPSHVHGRHTQAAVHVARARALLVLLVVLPVELGRAKILEHLLDLPPRTSTVHFNSSTVGDLWEICGRSVGDAGGDAGGCGEMRTWFHDMDSCTSASLRRAWSGASASRILRWAGVSSDLYDGLSTKDALAVRRILPHAMQSRRQSWTHAGWSPHALPQLTTLKSWPHSFRRSEKVRGGRDAGRWRTWSHSFRNMEFSRRDTTVPIAKPSLRVVELPEVPEVPV